MIKELQVKDNITTVGQLLSYQKGYQESPLLNVKKELQEDYRSLPNAPGIYLSLIHISEPTRPY